MNRSCLVILLISLKMLIPPTKAQGADGTDALVACDNMVTTISNSESITEMADLYLNLFHSPRARGKSDFRSEEAIWKEKLDDISAQVPMAWDLIRAEVSDRISDYQDKSDKIMNEKRERISSQVISIDFKFNVCLRSPAVLAAIVEETQKPCESITREDLSKIEELNLQNKNIKELFPYDFFGMDKLELIDLSKNNLTNLPDGLFQGLPTLGRIFLSNNQLVKLPKGLFKGLISLKSISLTDNMIEELDEDHFRGLKHLESLVLSNNRLTSLPGNLFNDLIMLELLCLDFNKFRIFPTHAMLNVKDLVLFLVHGNPLTFLPWSNFEFYPNLGYMKLPKSLGGSTPTHIEKLRSRVRSKDLVVEWE